MCPQVGAQSAALTARLVPLLTTFLACSTSLSAQTSIGKPTGPQGPQSSRARIEGRVTDFVTGVGVPGVAIHANGKKNFTISTDSDGNYVLDGVDPGDYMLFPVKSDYAKGMAANARRVHLAAGIDLPPQNFQLKRAAAISGIVTDSTRAPIAGARVGAWRMTYVRQRVVYQLQATTQTDAAGHYQISGLRAAQYYIGAFPHLLKPTFTEIADGDEKTGIARGFYPNGVPFDAAAPLFLGTGEVRAGVDLKLATTNSFCIGGIIAEGVRSEAIARTSVIVNETAAGWLHPIASGEVPEGSRFKFCGVPPGSYSVLVSSTDRNGALVSVGRSNLTVTNRNVNAGDLARMSVQDVTVSAAVVETDPATPTNGSFHLNLEPIGRLRYAGKRNDLDGRFDGDADFPGILEDDYYLNVSGLPQGYYLKSAMFAGKDVRTGPFTAGGGKLNLVFAADGPLVTGYAVDADGQSVHDAIVLLIAKGGSRFVRSTQADQNGFFQFLSGVAAGDYRLAAFADMELEDAENPALLDTSVIRAEDITVNARQSLQVVVHATRR